MKRLFVVVWALYSTAACGGEDSGLDGGSRVDDQGVALDGGAIVDADIVGDDGGVVPTPDTGSHEETPAPTLTEVSPRQGVVMGGTQVVLKGTSFIEPIEVFFGGTAASTIVVLDELSIAVTTPPSVAGSVDVRVVTPGGEAVVENVFTFVQVLPAGVTAGIAVYDRQTDTFTERYNVSEQFRSASVVKLLLALDYLWERGPDYRVAPEDDALFDAMLRVSDDSAASTLWGRGGGSQIIIRMVERLGLAHTEPPPAEYPTYWGYTALSVADTVNIYRYILEEAPAPMRNRIMEDLHAAGRCAADGYEQYFGIPEAFLAPWAIKQGWSGFGVPPPTVCDSGSASSGLASSAVDLTREALFTTGTVGTGDRNIVVVFTLHPDGTPLLEARNTLTTMTASLQVLGSVEAPASAWFGTWDSGVRVRSGASTASAVIALLPTGADVRVGCQKQGEQVTVGGYVNDWWAYLPDFGGYMTNIYLRVAENKLPGVPDC